MSLSEFDIIQQYFHELTPQRSDVNVGIGDDCAVLNADSNIVVTVDTLVKGVHFDDATPAFALGYKSVVVSLSDIAAMGALPAWLTLSLTLPEINENWLKEFSSGIRECCTQFGVSLVGGNMSSGPLTISTQLIGKQIGGETLLRSGAKEGDDIYVSGQVGEAGLGLLLHQNKIKLVENSKPGCDYLKNRWLKPIPRIALGQALVSSANACIDISDGLAADIKHLINASNVSATIHLERLPLYEKFDDIKERVGGWQHPVSAGEDYELCFTCDQSERDRVSEIANRLNVKITRIGGIHTAQQFTGRIQWMLEGNVVNLKSEGYQHFV